MKPLIDADVLLYECGFAAEASWKAEDKLGFPPFDRAAKLMDERIANICAMVDATEPPTLYLTGRGNFRIDIAKRTPYKERPSVKPYHYHNLKAYITNVYDCCISEGMEADDELAIALRKDPDNCIICTRDKDLRQVPGWQYGWELNAQPQFGPEKVNRLGWLKLSDGKPKKLTGTGDLFFYAQCLMGDSVDTIPGLKKGIGPVYAYEMLADCTSTYQAFERVLEAYRGVYGGDGDKELLEQGRLVYMTRYLDEWGYPVLWEFPNVV